MSNDNEINVYTAEQDTPNMRTVSQDYNGRVVTYPISHRLGGATQISATDSQEHSSWAGTRRAGVTIGVTPPGYEYSDLRPGGGRVETDDNGQALLFKYYPTQINGLHADPEVSERTIQQAMAVARRHAIEKYGEDITNSESLSPYSLKVVDYAQKRGLVKSPPSYEDPSKRSDWEQVKASLEENHEEDFNDHLKEYFRDDYQSYLYDRDAEADECHDDRCTECHGEDLDQEYENCSECYDCSDYRDEVASNTLDEEDFINEKIGDMSVGELNEQKKQHMKELRAQGEQGGRDAIKLEKFYNAYKLKNLPISTTSSGSAILKSSALAAQPAVVRDESGVYTSAEDTFPMLYGGTSTDSLTKHSPEYVAEAVTDALKTGREFMHNAAQIERDQDEAYKEYAALKERNSGDKDLFGEPLDQRSLMSTAEIPKEPTPKYRLESRGGGTAPRRPDRWRVMRPDMQTSPFTARFGRSMSRMTGVEQEKVFSDPEAHAAYDDNRYTYDELYSIGSDSSRSASFNNAVASSSDTPANKPRYRK